MFRKNILSFASMFLLQLSLIACSTQAPELTASLEAVTQSSVSQEASDKKPLYYGLGAKIEGVNKLTVSESGLNFNSFLPNNIDLRGAGLPPIYNQGHSNACGGFATAHGLAEYLLRKKGNQTPLSPRFVWNFARMKDNSLGKDAGVYLKTIEDVTVNVGMVPETDFPFPTLQQMQNINIYNAFLSEAPPPLLVKKAQNLRLSQGITKVTSLAGMKEALAKGMPVVFLMEIYESIFHTGSNGNIVMPSPKAGDKDHGGHFVLCVGYNEQKQQLIIRN